MPEELASTDFVFFGAFSNAQDLPVSFGINTYSYKDRYITNLLSPGAF